VPPAESPAPTASTVASTLPTVSTPPATTLASDNKLMKVPAGSTITLQAKELGENGQVLLIVDKVTMGVVVSEWASDHATATLPQLGIAGPTKAEIVLVKADGHVASSVNVELTPA